MGLGSPLSQGPKKGRKKGQVPLPFNAPREEQGSSQAPPLKGPPTLKDTTTRAGKLLQQRASGENSGSHSNSSSLPHGASGQPGSGSPCNLILKTPISKHSQVGVLRSQSPQMGCEMIQFGLSLCDTNHGYQLDWI